MLTRLHVPQRWRILALCLCWWAFALSTSEAATFWVAPLASNANDANSGSQASPWRTLWTGVAQRGLVGGNTINIVSGTYTRAQIMGDTSEKFWRTTQSRGTLNNLLVIQPEPGGQVIIDGGGSGTPFIRFVLLDGPSHDYHVALKNLWFRNFRIALHIGAPSPNTHARYVLIDGCRFENFPFINQTAATTSGFAEFIIFRNNIYNNIGTTGIPSPPPTNFNPQHAYYPAEGQSKLLIENNVYTHIANGGIEFWGETITPEPARHAIIRRNRIHNAGGAGMRISAQEYFDTYVYHNTIFSTSNPVPSVPGMGQTNGGIEPRSSAMRNFVLVNNIVYGNWEHEALRFNSAGADPISARMDGNLLFNVSSTARVVRYNAATMSWATYRSVTAGEGTPREVNGLSTNPQFTNSAAGNFVLLPSSPAINTGVFLTTTTNSGSNGTAMTLADSRYFHDGWNMIAGDVIQVAGMTPSTTVQISAINYTTHTLILASPRSWSTGSNVAQAWQGTKPDMGALEFAEAGANPPTITIATPTSATTYVSPTQSIATVAGTASDPDGAGTLQPITWTCPTCTPASGTASGTTSWTFGPVSLTAGVNNVITVSASDGTSTVSDTLTATFVAPVLAQPTNLQVLSFQSIAPRSADLLWQYSQGTTPAVGFRLYFQPACTGAFTQVGGTLPLSPTSTTHANVPVHGSYCWRVVALDGASNESAPSPTVSHTVAPDPPVPGGTGATDSGPAIFLPLTASAPVPLLVSHDPVRREHGFLRGLVEYWRVVPWLRAGTTWYGLTGRLKAVGRNLTGTVWGRTNELGRDGEIRLAGSNAHFETQYTGNGPFTLMLRAKGTVTTQATLAGQVNAGWTAGWGLWQDATGLLRCAKDTSTNAGTASVTLVLNVWTHIACSWDGTTLRLYTDGVFRGSLNDATPLASNVLLTLGGLPAFSTASWQGSFDSVMLLNHALAESTITALSEASRSGEQDLLRHWHLVPQWGAMAARGRRGSGHFFTR